MKNRIFTIILSLLLILGLISAGLSIGVAIRKSGDFSSKDSELDTENSRSDVVYSLQGKNLSILGDSISTYYGISNDSIYTNTTLGSNESRYPKDQIDSSFETWWGQACDRAGMTLLVNNSYSGAKVSTGNGAPYLTRCLNLHDNIGANAGTSPDIVAFFMGYNDLIAKLEVGEFTSVDEIYTSVGGYIAPENFAQGYAITVHKILSMYKDVDLFLFTLPPTGACSDINLLNSYNSMIKYIAGYFNCGVVDLADIEGYDYNALTSDGLHPNEAGMDVITDCFIKSLNEYYGTTY